MSKRAILYTRASSNDQGRCRRSLKSQLDMCREYAREHGYIIVAELAEDDRGVSGAVFDLPELSRALEMAQAGEADVLLTRELDRFARGLAKQLIVEREFQQAGTEVEFVLNRYPDTPEGQRDKHIRAVIAEHERDKINERVSRAIRLKVEAGSVMVHARPPYGYNVEDVDGKWVLTICEPEARIVRLIFQWYTRGDGESGPLSISAISERLTDMGGIPTRGDKDPKVVKRQGYGIWPKATVSFMLSNETYAGVWRYGRASGWDPADMMIVEVPAIIDRETWEEAQRRRSENRITARRNTKHKCLMRRRVTCGQCGAKMHVTTGDCAYYRCPAPYRSNVYIRGCEQRTGFRVDQVDAEVWEWVLCLTDPAGLAAGLWAEHQEREEAIRPLRRRLAVADDLLSENRQQLERLLDLYLAGDFPKEMLTDRKGRLETIVEALERERAGLVAQIEAQMLTADQVQSIQAFAAAISEGLEVADADFEDWRHLIELLDVRVTLVVEDGGKVAHVRCMLGESTLSIGSAGIRTS